MAQQRHVSEARGANPKVISGAGSYPVARDHSPDTKEWIKVAPLPWFFFTLKPSAYIRSRFVRVILMTAKQKWKQTVWFVSWNNCYTSGQNTVYITR